MADDSEDNGWPEYRREVMNAIARLEVGLEKVDSKVDRTREDVAGLKVRAGIAGTVMGFLASGAMMLLDHLLIGRSKP